MEKLLMADGTAIRVRDTQSGNPTLVLLHGYLESIEVWEDFIPRLSPPLRVIAPDLPGHGISEVKGPVHTMEFLADTVHGALTRLGVTRCFIAGHSMGGYVALEFLRKYPQMLAGIILLHSTPNPDSDAKKEMRQREIELVLAGKKDLLARTNPEKRFAPENRVRLAAKIDELADQVMLTEDEGIVASLRGMCARSDLNAVLASSHVPQLIVLGRGDEHIPTDLAQAMIDRHPQARIVWLDHAGHMGFVEQPEPTAQAILDFVAKPDGK